MEERIINKKSRDYLTNFFRRRSIIALCCGICVLILSFYGMIAGVIRTITVKGRDGFSAFLYFTRLSNLLAMVSVSFLIPYAVEGIKKRRFVLPKWVAILHYLSATSIAIMMAFVFAFLSWTSPDNAFGGIQNIFLHIVCPILILISYFQIENQYQFSLKDCLIGCIPFYLYLVVYIIEVLFIGEANGGWRDLYHVQEYVSPVIIIPLLLLFGFVISCLVAWSSNYFVKKHKEKMFLCWNKDVDPTEAKIEAYGLGSMMSKIKDENNIVIPLDILGYLSEKAHLNTDDLIKSYMAGFLNEKKDKS